MRKHLIALSLICSCVVLNAQSNIDVLHYRFHIGVSDANDSIYGVAIIKFVVKEKAPFIQFDLAGLDKKGKGMLVTVVGYKINYSNATTFKQENDHLIIPSNLSLNKGDTSEVIINYKGIPSDGLIISKNKFGHRSFFSDNWPNQGT